MNRAPLPLIAREEELRRLLVAWQRAWEGERVVAVIGGEPGTGRSRLMSEVAYHPSLQQALIVELRIGSDHPDGVEDAVWRAMQSALTRRGSALARNGGRTPVGVEQIARELDEVARHIPLVLVVDDVGRRSRDAAELGELLQRVSSPFFVLVAVDLRQIHVGDLIARYADAALVEIRIRPLDIGSVAAVIRRVFGIRLDERELLWLSDRTHGVPLLMREVLGAAIESRCIVRESDGWRQLAPLSDCDRVLDTILPLAATELRRLDESVRAALARLAVLGPFSTASARSAIGVDEDVLEPAVAADIVERQTFAFTCRLYHTTALMAAMADGLPGRCAQALRTWWCSPDRTDVIAFPAESIRALLDACTSDDERDAAIAGLRSAGEALVNDGRHAEAAVMLRWARPRTDDDPQTPARVAAWTELFARALFSVGRTEEHRALIDEFLATCGEAPSPDVVPTVVSLLLALAGHHERHRDVELALQCVERAEALIDRLADPLSALAHRARIRRAQVLTSAGYRDDAIAIYRSIFEPDSGAELPALFDALLFFTLMARRPDEIEEADRRTLELLDRCESEGRDREVVQLKAARLGLLMMGNDVDRHESLAREVIDRVRGLSLPRTEANALGWLAIILAERGEDEDAALTFDRALEIRHQVGSMGLWQLTLVNRIYLLVRAGRDEEARAALELLDEDVRAWGRVHRRFLADACRLHLGIRSGEAVGAAQIDALVELGREEGFIGVDVVVLTLEGEALLHVPSVDVASAMAYAKKVLDRDPTALMDRLLFVVALAALARAIELPGVRRTAAEELVATLRDRVRASVAVWNERSAPKQIARARALLNANAPREVLEELALADADAADRPYQTWHHCEISTFGGLRVLDPSGQEKGGRHFGSNRTDTKPRKLLAALAVARVLGRRLKRERLIDMVWGEDVGVDATNNFHVTLSGLRRVIGDAVDFDGSTYTLNTRLALLDAVRFTELADRAAALEARGLAFRAVDALREACGLVDGEFLEGIYDDWVDGARDLLRSRVRGVRLRMSDLALRRGETDAAVATISRLLETDPLDEEAMALRLRLLDLGGERARAIREYQRFVERLRDEYGVEPSGRLAATELQFLQTV